MISEAKLREIEAREVQAMSSDSDIPALTKALREAAEIIGNMRDLHIWYPLADEWLREWRGETE